MIQAENLTKFYGENPALRGVSFNIEQGEVVGLLGPNGAGKTTTMKILTGYLMPSDGRARVAGYDVLERPLEVQRRIGYLPENAPLYYDMLVQDYLLFIADMRELEPHVALRRLGETAEICGLADVLTRPIGELSKGYRQRVGLAAALLHDPEILILDEPTSGLDPNQIAEVRELIRHMGRTKTVILSTHILPEVEATCRRAIIVIDGQIRADGTLEALTQARAETVTLAAPDAAEARQALEGVAGVGSVAETAVQPDGFRTFRLELTGDADVGEAVYELARQRGWRLRELRRDEKTLEQVFRELTERPLEVAA